MQMQGKVLTQMHEATDAETAMLEGMRPLVHKSALDGQFNVDEPASTMYL